MLLAELQPLKAASIGLVGFLSLCVGPTSGFSSRESPVGCRDGSGKLLLDWTAYLNEVILGVTGDKGSLEEQR